MAVERKFPILLAAAAVVGLFLVAKVVKILFYDPLRKIPGPLHTRFTNLGLKKAIITGKRIYYLQSLFDKYGPVVRVSPDEVAINDVHAFKEIHRVGSGFNKPIWYQKFNPGRPGVFAMIDPKQHAARRKLFARAFSKTFLRQHWESTVQEKIELAISQMRNEGQTCGKVDVYKWWMFMATDVSTHLMFGESFRCLEAGEKSAYNRILESAMKGAGMRVEIPPAGWIGMRLPLQAAQEMFNANALLLEYGTVAVKNSKAMGSKANIFANMIAEAEKGETEQLTDLDVKLEASNLIVAGADTTGVTMTYLTWAVLQKPGLQRQLENEVRNIGDRPTDDELEKLPLLNAVIEETLRLYGAAPGGLPRVVPPGGATLGGYFIPEGTIVTTQAYSLHRDSTNFSLPHNFDPARWLPENTAKMSDASKTAFSPFGAGARICLGIHLARMELRLAAAMFFKNFPGAKIASSMTSSDMEMENYFLIAPKNHKCEIVL